jgi:hypothetical protein
VKLTDISISHGVLEPCRTPVDLCVTAMLLIVKGYDPTMRFVLATRHTAEKEMLPS